MLFRSIFSMALPILALAVAGWQVARYYRPFDVPLVSPMGFVRTESFFEGEEVPIYYHAEQPIRVDVFALRRRRERVATMRDVPARRQASRFSPVAGFDWHDPLLISTKGFPPGYYLAEVREADTNRTWEVAFVVKPTTTARVAVIASTNTWQIGRAHV